MIRIAYLFIFIFLGCNNNPTLPKPKAFLYKEFTKPNYKIYKNENISSTWPEFKSSWRKRA